VLQALAVAICTEPECPKIGRFYIVSPMHENPDHVHDSRIELKL
jgi:hypothetical protein